ncbi:hypothetical protein B0J17DRAFT_633668 [Rhizoctonia solani]|nr:hypothetical protein B0J17DRAFT_633668 [Rhizoctonia solani]
MGTPVEREGWVGGQERTPMRGWVVGDDARTPCRKQAKCAEFATSGIGVFLFKIEYEKTGHVGDEHRLGAKHSGPVHGHRLRKLREYPTLLQHGFDIVRFGMMPDHQRPQYQRCNMGARYSKLSDPPHELKSYPSYDAEPARKDEGSTTRGKPCFVSWFYTIWTLVLHCLLSLVVAALVLFYVQGCHFNVTERTPAVNIVEGKLKAPFNLLQSDVVTVLSALIVALRCSLMAWGTPLIWRVAVFLMERRGLSRRNLKTLLDYGVLGRALTRATFPRSSSASFSGRPIAISPRLFSQYWKRWSWVGAGHRTWRSKRVSNSIETLAINSTVDNVTLPYFKVHSIQWIQNRDDIPAFRGKPFGDALEHTITRPRFLVDDPMETTTIRDTRLLVLYYQYISKSDLKSQLYANLPPTHIHDDEIYFYAYAWVTFIDLEPHPLTFQALSLAPVVGLHLAALNTSLPLPWNNIEAYIEAVLVRSYSGAWFALSSRMWTQSAHSSYIPSFPGLMALVDNSRVYIWLGLQLLVTLLGAIFLVIQSSRSKYSLIGDTTLTAFYVDTTAIPRSGKDAAYSGDEVLRIEPRGDRLRVKLERPDWNL